MRMLVPNLPPFSFVVLCIASIRHAILFFPSLFHSTSIRLLLWCYLVCVMLYTYIISECVGKMRARLCCGRVG